MLLLQVTEKHILDCFVTMKAWQRKSFLLLLLHLLYISCLLFETNIGEMCGWSSPLLVRVWFLGYYWNKNFQRFPLEIESFICMELYHWVCKVLFPLMQSWKMGSWGFRARSKASPEFLFHGGSGYGMALG